MAGVFRSIRIETPQISWISVFYYTFGSTFFYSFMEWVFFVTKPSFMNGLSLWQKLKVWLLASFALCGVFFCLLLLLGAISRIIPSGKIRSAIQLIGALVPALILTVTALLLLDNFTYTLFKFGIVSTTGILRVLYGAAFLAALALLFKHILPSLGGNQLTRKAGITTGGMVCLLILAGSAIPDSAASFAWNITQPVTNRPNIILLGSDGITASHLSLYGYERKTTPFLDSLAADSLVMENHLTNSGNTSGSLISIFTGKLPTQTRVIYPPDILQSQDAYQHFPSILETLGYFNSEIAIPHYLDAADLNLKGGFDMVNEKPTREDPLSQAFRRILPDDVVYFLENLMSRAGDRLGHIFFIHQMSNPYTVVTQPSEVVDDEHRLAELIQIIQQENGPFFVHVHLMGTHGSTFLPKNDQFSKGEKQDKEWMPDFYDDSILDFDQYVQQVVDALKTAGKWDNTILLVYTDHAAQWQTTERIPLLIHFPGDQYAGIISTNTENLDIGPTLLDYLGIDQPGWMGGQSLIAHDPPRQRPIYSAGVGTIEDVGNGWWFYDLNSAKPPFYQFGFFTETVCQKWVKWTVSEQKWSIGTLEGDDFPCAAEDLPSTLEMERDLVTHIQQNGFDVSSIHFDEP